MRSGSAESPARRLKGWCAALVAAALLVAGAACSDDVSIEPPRATGAAGSEVAQQAPRILADLTKAITERDSAAATALGTAEAAGLLRSVVANAADLDLSDLAMRFVTEGPEPDDSQAASLPNNAELATIHVDYRIEGWDRAETSLETTVVLVPDGTRLLVGGFGTAGDRTPLWLTGRVTVRSSGRVLVIASGAERAARMLRLGRSALAGVAKVLPRWHGRLVLEAPESKAALDATLSAEPDQYANIAAVTTTVDGSATPDSPVHVFINPAVFDDLGPKGSQVVITHEATHVATGATFAALPTWLSEGFADYVALAHAGVPLDQAAGQILAKVRKQGPPKALPSATDLQPTAGGLGATYELAWLACRYIAQQYGERALVAFYDAVDGGRSLDEAFEAVLHTSQARFVKAWSRDVAALAGVGG